MNNYSVDTKDGHSFLLTINGTKFGFVLGREKLLVEIEQRIVSAYLATCRMLDFEPNMDPSVPVEMAEQVWRRRAPKQEPWGRVVEV